MAALPVSDHRERLGAIDVGSNSIRLLVAEYDPGAGLKVIDEVKEQPRLAAGIARTGRLDPEAIERALAALRRMQVVCQRRGVKRVAAVATAAVREAANGEEFVAQVRREVGIPLTIIDPRAEAVLSYRSVAHHFPPQQGRTVVADIGGGSLELIAAVDGIVEDTVSLPFGAVRLTELHLGGHRDQRKAVKRLREFARRQFRRKLPLRDWSATTLIGSGGSFTNLGRMAAARRGASAEDPVHGTSVSVVEIEHLLERLTGLSPEKRAQVPGLNPLRADIILAGLAVTVELLERIEAREVLISAFGLREGLVLQMAGADTRAAGGDKLRLLREFAERCHCDRAHIEHVRTLALTLHDELGEHLEAGPEDRGLLEAAALLHDVGQLVSYRKHHKHSYQLINHAEGLPLSSRERMLVSLISRYHRRKGPRRKHREFGSLTPADQVLVRRLAGILRVAEGLERGHTGIVETIRCEWCPTQVTLRVASADPDADLSLECWGAAQAADVLGEVLGLEVLVEPDQKKRRMPRLVTSRKRAG